jgi:lipid II:glycine glycyltransferase (peptidoglycan interpeptide bridge formation enzyme)
MKFINNVTKEQYNELYQQFPTANFMQMYEWGQVIGHTRKQIPMYVGMEDETGTLIAGALLLKKKTPLHMCYFYSPRGFLIDFHNPKLVQEFTIYLKQFLKEQNGIYIKVDPEIIYQQIDENGNVIQNEDNNYDIYQMLVSLGYHHKGFNVLFEYNQPRFTFRRYFSKYNDVKAIDKSLSKTFMNTVKRSYKYEQVVSEGFDPELFYDLANQTADKDGFSAFTKAFYKEFWEVFHALGKAKIFNVIVYPDCILEKNKKELMELKEKLEQHQLSKKAASDAPDVIRRLEKDITTFAPYKGKYPNGYVVASLMCSYSEEGLYTLYLGNNDLALHTFSINRLYYEVILECYEQGLVFMDLFGTIGNPKLQYQNLATLHDFKRKFGDEYTEFIGEFDLINKPFWYKVLPHLLKVYRKIRG